VSDLKKVGHWVKSDGSNIKKLHGTKSSNSCSVRQ